MVSPIRPRITLEIERPDEFRSKSTFPHGHIFEDLVINWGRQSLFSPPMNRTCDFMVRTHIDIDAYLYATVRVRRDSTLLFEGSLDRLERTTKVMDGRTNQVIIGSAVEHRRLYPDLVKNVDLSPDNPFDLWYKMHFDWGFNTRDIEVVALPQRDMPIYGLQKSERFSLYSAFSAIAATPPLAHANWLPGFKKVQSTTWSRRQIPTSRTYTVPTSMVEAPRKLWTSIDEMPKVVRFRSGGEFGDPENGTDVLWVHPSLNEGRRFLDRPFRLPRDQLRTFIPREVRQPIPVWNYRQGEIEQACDFLELNQKNRIAPFQVRVADTHPGFSWNLVEPLFNTWEPLSMIYFVGKFPDPYGEKPWAPVRGVSHIPIGGTLRIKHASTTHDLTLLPYY